MPIEFWGATGAIGVSLPGRPLGYALLTLYLLLLAFAVYRYREAYARLTSRQWGIILTLSFLSLLLSQLFPIPLAIDDQLAPINLAQNPVTTLTMFAAVPFLLAGAILNPAAALIVGFFSGIGRSLGQTHTLFDPFHFALAAVLAAIWMQQNYRGRVFQWLRQPVVAGALNTVGLFFWVGVAAFVSVDPAASYLAALDLALSTASANFWPLLIEGAVGGGIVTLVLIGAPQLKPRRPLVPSFIEVSLRNRLLSNFIIFAVALVVLLVVVVFTLSINVSTRLVVNQMAHDAQTVAAEIPDFQASLQNLLLQYNDDEDLLAGAEASKEALAQLFRASPSYRRVLVVDEERNVTAAYPADANNTITLTEQEKTAVTRVLTTNAPDITPAETVENEHILSFVVPVRGQREAPTAVLVGRVPQLSLKNLVFGLQGTVGRGTGFIVDERGQIIAHSDTDRLLTPWSAPEDAPQIRTDSTAPGVAYQGRQSQTNTRELVYYISQPTHPWTVVLTVPYEVVLRLALNIGAPLTLVLVLLLTGFYANLAVLGREITQPITEMVEASRTIAAGGKWTPAAEARREDEIGQLHQAFYQMYHSRNKRLNELSLLLGVSHEVATNMDVSRGMTAILRGALRGTVAIGARAVVLNPSGGYPLQFGEGPAAVSMASLDRRIMSNLRHVDELTLTTPEEIRAVLEIKAASDLPVRALLAIPLHSRGRFQGVLWFGYRQPGNIESSESNLLHTLAGQAAVLVENAHLFATAEGGRRRLAAVLSSTTDAVIVTDQTERVLLVNRAFERAFKLRGKALIGRPVTAVLPVPTLVDALTGTDERARNLEIPGADDRIYYASVAPNFSNDGQALGRVAVLHDITHYKEIDQMKSEFVHAVSHDLRNPLTFMRGYTTMLSMVGEINDDQQVYINKIQTGIDHMTDLVTNLLDLGRIEAGIEMDVEEFGVKELLDEIAEEYWQHAHLSGIKIKVRVPDETPPVPGDKMLIRQALTNLLSNGIKYAPDSGVLELRGEQVDGEIVFSVKDNGPGISKQAQMRLFEKFFRVNDRGQEKKRGAGLGLAIVKSIAERHGGRAWCYSQKGKGSTFYLSVPLAAPSDNGSGAGESRSSVSFG